MECPVEKSALKLFFSGQRDSSWQFSASWWLENKCRSGSRFFAFRCEWGAWNYNRSCVLSLLASYKLFFFSYVCGF